MTVCRCFDIPVAASAERRLGVTAFFRDTRGGAMLVGGGLIIALLATVGSLMANYAWREAQLAELDGALRASVSATGALLAGAGGAAMNTQIGRRVEDVLTALVDAIEIDSVTVSYDQAAGFTDIELAATFSYESIWGQPGGAFSADRTIRVRLETDRYEIAVAADLSPSMNYGFGSVGTRLDGLKAAMASVAAIMQTAGTATPGTTMASIVPFAAAVNVADTGGNGQTAGKERYVRMLVGPAGDTSQLLERARQQASEGKGGHWVDTFHSYGVGDDMGPLLRRFLPKALRDGTDWNLRSVNVAVDVSTQAPQLGTWTIDHADFWNGCVMARWGAYWNTDARGSGWLSTNPGNWPASSQAAAWSPRGTTLPTTPLHLSDAPPSAADPNTLFTAYSWPDARIGGTATARLHTVMMELLDGQGDARHARLVSHNDWSLSDGGGDGICPPTAITPLTDNITEFTNVINGLQVAPSGPGGTGGTYLNLGMVWALRTLSPLWKSVWNVRDVQGAPRPLAPCASGETQNCAARLRKTILLVSDGESASGGAVAGPVLERVTGATRNPWLATSYLCLHPYNGNRPDYAAAWEKDTAANFNASFGTHVDSTGEFTTAAIGDVVDELMTYGDTLPDGATRRGNLNRRLIDEDTTPWKLFRGTDGAFNDFLMDAANEFGFDGRPIHPNRDVCSWLNMFTPFGRTGDFVQVDGAPVSGFAPFANTRPTVPSLNNYTKVLDKQLSDWFIEACKVAGRRNVRVEAIFIGNRGSTTDIAALESCVDAAGGDPNNSEVYVTPDAATLKAAFTDIFTVRRNLRFVN